MAKLLTSTILADLVKRVFGRVRGTDRSSAGSLPRDRIVILAAITALSWLYMYWQMQPMADMAVGIKSARPERVPVR